MYGVPIPLKYLSKYTHLWQQIKKPDDNADKTADLPKNEGSVYHSVGLQATTFYVVLVDGREVPCQDWQDDNWGKEKAEQAKRKDSHGAWWHCYGCSAADRADPASRQLLKRCSGRNV